MFGNAGTFGEDNIGYYRREIVYMTMLTCSGKITYLERNMLSNVDTFHKNKLHQKLNIMLGIADTFGEGNMSCCRRETCSAMLVHFVKITLL